ncbi:MAG: response regulator [Magnetococcales bacterium]|nr:response regulator [Magnetococcales bacterium]
MGQILVIDDDEQFLGFLKEILLMEGLSVETATNGKEGLHLLEKTHFDLIISDVFMPETDGIMLLRALRKSHPGIKIIGISGGGRGISAAETLPIIKQLGAAKVLSKPFTRKELLPLVYELLGKKTGVG